MGAARSFGLVARGVVVAALCGLLVEQPLLAEAAVRADGAAPAVVAAGQIQGDERVLHALNRFTFGPRPGDVAVVRAMGVEKWFEGQLNPGSIDDAALNARLALYPATRLPIEQLETRYPGPQMLKQMASGRVPLPSDPVLHAMVKDQLAFYEMAQERAGKISANDAALALAGEAPGRKAKKAMPVVADGAGADEAGAGGAGAGGAAPAMTKRQRRQAAAQAASDQSGPGSGGTLLSDGTMSGAAAGGMANQIDGAQPGGQKVDSKGELANDPVAAIAARPGFVKVPPEEVNRVLAQAPAERFQATLAMEPMDLARFRASMNQRQVQQWTAGMTPEQREIILSLGSGLRMVAQETTAARLERDIYSDRQLEAVMTDFWLNHFNVYAAKSQVEPYLLATYERETIRPHALGRFEDLLVATAKSPAMLVYLDNAKSVGPDTPAANRGKRAKQALAGGMPDGGPLVAAVPVGLNENYGREVMELHTLGVNGGGYTQADVTNVAKVFTGWTLDRPYQGSGYVFDERKHEPGDKLVLGRTIHEGGEREGLQVLHMLATNPATARFISTKLAVRFVSDDPPAALVDKMTATFLKSDGDMKKVLRAMFDAPEFWSEAVYRAKVKTPLEFVVSAARAGQIEVEQPGALVQSLAKLGMPLYGMQTPNGYSWKSDQWVSTGALVSRLNFSLVLSDDRMPGTRTEWAKLLGEAAALPGGSAGAGITAVSFSGGEPAEGKERKLEVLLLGQPVSDRTRQTVLTQSTDGSISAQAETEFDLSNHGKGAKKLGQNMRGMQKRQDGVPPDDAQAALMAGLLMGSPEFQRR